jgi:hypothetical protein
MAQQSARRGRKNQMNSSCLEHAFMIWFRSANSHTGPQLHRCTIRGRTDGSVRLRADLLQKPLASRGASTDEFTPLVICHALCLGETDGSLADVKALLQTREDGGNWTMAPQHPSKTLRPPKPLRQKSRGELF